MDEAGRHVTGLPLGIGGQRQGGRAATSEAPDGSDVSTALHVLCAAVDAQRQRQAAGTAACDAVQGISGDAPSEVAARARAQLVAQLHAREAAVLTAALADLSNELATF